MATPRIPRKPICEVVDPWPHTVRSMEGSDESPDDR